ncbi:hypothetical protein Cob_v009960 [Colletotrichum orbiculare MAFF 240422]|uniref:Ankyrin repeat protein n=1 Tax=Colletotrichum orbiculare (strain 104-T / ATCC 96160 / CBS 514.97 / LARS 414 / MAFF 240422) TaxID=1213857 RepID=A0A484FI39_COLOR|nr:hypothetical protein Cob_v009960 [Colletotrichum orbiculare MAFF 240422]
MIEANRAADLLGQVGLLPPKPIQNLTRPSTIINFQNSPPESAKRARRLLVEQRVGEPDYQPPEKQIVHLFRTKKRKEAAINGTNWVFSKHEVAKAFHSLICSSPLPPAGVAQALLAFAPGTPLTELWSHLFTPTNWKNKRKSASPLALAPPRVTWLETVVAQNNLQYVCLLCQAQIGQAAIDRALGFALSESATETVAFLLGFTTVASKFREAIQGHILRNNVALVRSLLSTDPNFGIDAWRFCLTPAVTREELSEILLHCFANRPELACAPMLLSALRSQNLPGTAIILAYAGPANDFSIISSKACELAFRVENLDRRLKLFTMLSHAGLVIDGDAARQHLMVEARAGNLDVVKVLVAAGVRVDVAPNHALLWAIKTLDFEMLEVLKMASTTTPLSDWLTHVPESASESDVLRLLAICKSQGKLGGEPLDWHLVRAVKRKEKKLMGTLVRLGASIDFGQASALETMRLLLEKAGFTEIGQSDLLLQETKAATSGDSQGLKILIRHNPAGDFKGEYLCVAAASGSLEVVNMLISLAATNVVLKRACLAAAKSSLNGAKKQAIVDRLLEFRKLPEEDLSEVLAKSVSGAPSCGPLTDALLRRGAKVTFQILEDAAQRSSRGTFEALVANTKDETVLRETFKSPRTASLSSDRKYWVYRHLLKRRTLSSDDVSQALLDCIRAGRLEDTSLPELFLRYGADVKFRNGAAFAGAFHSGSPLLINLLVQQITDDGTVSLVFDLARKTPALPAKTRLELYHRLLQRGAGISISSKYSALVDALKSRHRDVAMVRLLLASGVDPNTDNARCFVMAAEHEAEADFRALSKKADFSTVAKALMKLFKNETEAVKWLRMCLVERTSRETIGEDDLIFQCLRRFPRGTSLLRLFLDNGASVSSTTRHRLGPGMDAEDVTILIWALMSQMPRISTEGILLLIKHGQQAVLPAYVSPRTKLSAAFACVLDPSRARVLEALLRLDEGKVTGHTMPGNNFSSLIKSQHSVCNELEFLSEIVDLKLVVACLVTGNFEAFVPLVSRIRTAETETTLHFAAFLGLPDFVAWLLREGGQDANEASEDFGFFIPLAVACSAKPLPECIFADAAGDSWARRQKKTMRVLAAKTDTSWRSLDKMSLLHIALDNGPEVTALMVQILDIRHDRLRDCNYLYEDRDHVLYSPDQYVVRIMKPESSKKKALLDALTAGRMSPRYYKDVSPRHGSIAMNLTGHDSNGTVSSGLGLTK